MIYFPTNWGAKEPQNLPNHRVAAGLTHLKTNEYPLEIDRPGRMIHFLLNWDISFIFQGGKWPKIAGVSAGGWCYSNLPSNKVDIPHILC